MDEDMDEEDRYLTPAEVSRIFRVTPRTITSWCENGKLKHYKTPGGHRRIPLEEVLRYVRATHSLNVLGDDGRPL